MIWRLFFKKVYSTTALGKIEIIRNKHRIPHILFENKENLLCEPLTFVPEGRFKATANLLNGITDDKLLFLAAETTLQLYIAENNENIWKFARIP